ncbi:MAG: WYL domain-containing protein [Lachnospiraceae bacterium]|jgi:predicted DNA-binding transcriptional regulator YafY|nr:WYL domain-containing protein [Lachnospiraceae bacterium]
MPEDQIKTEKLERILGIYTKLMHGQLVRKAQEAADYGVNERSIQRDINEIRNFLDAESDRVGYIDSVIYDHHDKGYRLEHIHKMKFTNSEVLAISKILLESRAFTKKEMTDMLDKLITGCVPKAQQAQIDELIKNEAYHYIEPRHKTKFIDMMWDLGQAIRSCQYIEITYNRRKDNQEVKRKLKPVAILFSEYYFYLTAFIDDEDVRKDFDVPSDPFPTIYRIDKIRKMKIQNEKFHIPYKNRFEEGEFRKRIQFMYGGQMQKVTFRYLGTDVDAILDRLPTAKVIHEEGGVYTITAEVFGKGIDMWLKSQGDLIKVV